MTQSQQADAPVVDPIRFADPDDAVEKTEYVVMYRDPRGKWAQSSWVTTDPDQAQRTLERQLAERDALIAQREQFLARATTEEQRAKHLNWIERYRATYQYRLFARTIPGFAPVSD